MSSLKKQILFSYSHDELTKLMSTNPAFSCLVYDDEFWFEKASKEFRVNLWYWNLTAPYLAAYDNYLTISFENKVVKDSCRVFDRQVCLARAARLGDGEMVDYFIDSLTQDGLEPNFVDAFNKAFAFGRVEICRKLFPYVSDKKLYILLGDACESGQIELVEMYFQAKENASTNFMDVDFEFVMILALSHSVEFYLQVERMVKLNMPEKPFNIRTFFRYTGRREFCVKAKPEVMEFLRKMGIEKEQENVIKQRASDARNFALCEEIGGEYFITRENPIIRIFKEDDLPSFKNYLVDFPHLLTSNSWFISDLFKTSLKNRSYSIAQFIFEETPFNTSGFAGNCFAMFFEKIGILCLIREKMTPDEFQNWFSKYFITIGCPALLPICFGGGCPKELYAALVKKGENSKFRHDTIAFLHKFAKEN